MEQPQGKSDTNKESAINRALLDKGFSDFGALPDSKKFEICKLAIENMVTALQGVNLRKLDVAIFETYEDELYKITGQFQKLHESPIGNQLKMDKFMPFIRETLKHLSSALEYKKEGKLFDYFDHLQEFPAALYKAKEELGGVSLE